MKTIVTLLFLFIISANSFADNNRLSIQIAATEKIPDLTYYKNITGLNSIYIDETQIGLFRVKAGSYETRADAEYALAKLKAKGLTGVFITPNTESVLKTGYKVPKVSNSEVSTVSPAGQKVSPSSMPIWKTLSAEQKRNIVYLDGILHLKENGKFIPLSNY